MKAPVRDRVDVTDAKAPLVLLVADDLVQARTARTLSSCFTVASASTLFGARSLLSGVRFDAVVTVLALSDGSGAQLLAELRDQAPSVARILIIGADDAAREAAVPDGVAQLNLSKSIPAPDLIQAIRSLLTRAERRTASGEVPKGSTPTDDD